MMKKSILLVALAGIRLSQAFQPPISGLHVGISRSAIHPSRNQNDYLPEENKMLSLETPSCKIDTPSFSLPAASLWMTILVALWGLPEPALAAAGPVAQAVFAWFHFLGIIGVAGGLVTERFLIGQDMDVDTENKINFADLIYGLSAFSLLITGILRLTIYAKGWEFYQNEPIFWLKMSVVAVLGGLSFFPAAVFFRRDQARKAGATLAPLSDPLVERITRLINAELLAFVTIPFLASLMARGVLYVENFPWPVGVVLYVLSLGGAGYKYGKEAFDMMEEEGALVDIKKQD